MNFGLALSLSLVLASSCIAAGVECNQLYQSLQEKHDAEVLSGLKDEPTALLFDQKVDHFNAQNLNTFKQRYYYLNDYGTDEGLVIFYIGGEGTLRTGEFHGGLVWYLCRIYQCTMFALEHRYYGESLPFMDLTTENMTYLSMDQALADHAYFATKMMEDHADLLLSKRPRLIIGCSYPGVLSANARLKYPNIYDGALSFSSPVIAKSNFFEYADKVRSVLSQTNSVTTTDTCSDAVGVALSRIDYLVKQGYQEWQNLNTDFHLSPPLTENSTEFDVYMAIDMISTQMFGDVQYCEPFGKCSVQKSCDHVMQSDEYYANYADFVVQANNGTVSYDLVSYLLSQKSGTSSTIAGRNSVSWFYQKTTEFGYYKTQTTERDWMPDILKDLNYWINRQAFVFGNQFLAGYPPISWINSAYAADNRAQTTGVLFINGYNDPWSTLSVTSTISPYVTAHVYQKWGHCAPFYYDGTASTSGDDEINSAVSSIKSFVQTVMVSAKTVPQVVCQHEPIPSCNLETKSNSKESSILTYVVISVILSFLTVILSTVIVIRKGRGKGETRPLLRNAA